MNFPIEEPSVILDNLYLGNEYNVISAEQLVEYDINYILNINSKEHFKDTEDFHYFSIELYNTTDNLIEYFEACFTFLEHARKKGRNVIIACKSGNNRSAAICLGYIMTTKSCTLHDAYLHLKNQRPSVDINNNFLGQLLKFEETLFGHSISDQKMQSKPLHTHNVSSLSDQVLDQHYYEISEEIKRMISSDQWKVLGRVYSHCRGTEEILMVIRKNLFVKLKEESNRVLDTMKDQKSSEESNLFIDFVHQAQSIFTKYQTVLDQHFQEDNSIQRTINMGFKHLLSVSAYSVKAVIYYFLKSQFNLFKKNTINNGEEQEEYEQNKKRIREMCTFIQYLNQKDKESVLKELERSIAFYLLHSTNDEWSALEQVLIQQLEQIGAVSLCEQIRTMVQDKTVSIELSDHFKEEMKESQLWQLSFSAQVLSASIWSNLLFPQMSNTATLTMDASNVLDAVPGKCVLPLEVEKCWQLFMKYYQLQKPGRKVKLLSEMGTSILKANINNKSYELTVTTPMLAILELFNSADRLSLQEIQFVTNLQEPILKNTMKTLTSPITIESKKGRIPPLLIKSGTDEDTFAINPKFEGKSRRYTLVM